jgi:hypothetical protein
MFARGDEPALLAVCSELYDWLASQGEHASANVTGLSEVEFGGGRCNS